MKSSHPLNSHLIIISGKKRVGKDTLYLFLRHQSQFQIKQVVYANEIKKLLEPVLQRVGYNVWSNNDVEKEQFRSMLQVLGDLGRKTDINFWIKLGYQNIIAKHSENDIWINTDTRYENELNYFDDKFKKIIKIRLINDLNDLTDTHISETALDGKEDLFDLVFYRSKVEFSTKSYNEIGKQIFDKLGLEYQKLDESKDIRFYLGD